jgi:hypothetical protein
MPRHVLHDESDFLVVLEVISCDVNDLSAKFKPRMSWGGLVVKHVVRAAMALLMKVLSKEERGVLAAPYGEALQSGRKVYRINLFNRPSKKRDVPLYLLALVVCEVTGSIYSHHGYLRRVDATPSDQAAEEMDRAA